jgi:hypothetical protein
MPCASFTLRADNWLPGIGVADLDISDLAIDESDPDQQGLVTKKMGSGKVAMLPLLEIGAGKARLPAFNQQKARCRINPRP